MKTERIKTVDLKYLIGEVISGEEYRAIFRRQLCMWQLEDLLQRVVAHVYPKARVRTGVTMTWEYTEVAMSDAQVVNIDVRLIHNTAMVEFDKRIYR